MSCFSYLNCELHSEHSLHVYADLLALCWRLPAPLLTIALAPVASYCALHCRLVLLGEWLATTEGCWVRAWHSLGHKATRLAQLLRGWWVPSI